MTFGEKLRLLRKEKGYSQEEFAEMIGVSRQAVSKWEGDRGMPEIEKILQISNMYSVTLDYLLKDENVENDALIDGYYVSREMIDGFLAYREKQFRLIAIGIGLIIVADIFDSFPDYKKYLIPFYWLSIAVGISILIWTILQPRRYQEITSKRLVFDDVVIKTFREESGKNRKRYALMIIVGVLLFFGGTEVVSVFDGLLGHEIIDAIGWIIDAIAIMLLITAGGTIHSEYIIAQNDRFIDKRSSRGGFTWIYVALPITAVAIVIGFTTNAWSPVFPVFVLFCALLVTVCKLVLEKRRYTRERN